MALATFFVLMALSASAIQLGAGSRLWAGTAMVVSLVQAAMLYGWLDMRLRGVPITLFLGGLLCVAGIMQLRQVGGRTLIASTTLITLVGSVQVLSNLGVLRG